MRFNPIPLIAGILLLSLSSKAQEVSRYTLRLASGDLNPSANISADKLKEFDKRSAKLGGKSFAIIQFEQIPTEQQKRQLKQQGIELLEYVPAFAYTASITGMPDSAFLRQMKTRALLELTAQQKMQPALAAGNFPARAVKVAGTVDVWISFPTSFTYTEVNAELRGRNFDILSADLKTYRILSVRTAVQRLGELALLPCVEFVQAIPGEDKPLSSLWGNRGKDGMRVSLLNAPVSQGGKNLKGSGVVIGIGDNDDPQPHVDFSNRIIPRSASGYYPPFGHGTHVTGIASGAGIVNEVRTGYAPKSTIVSQVYSNIFTNAPAYVTDYGMVITNNSYGNSLTECETFGVYDLYSRILDQQAYDLPELQQVFAAGNSGSLSCSPFPSNYRTVLGGYQSAKNILTVANARPHNGVIFLTSSRGPVRDGRLKPEITGVGSFITSTGPYSTFYYENTGTSMSSPAVAGGIALLYEKYKMQNGGANPKNGLIKALVCNSGEDWGNPGPDYTHGFGLGNFWRAVSMLENNRFITGNILPGLPETFSVNVPGGLAELKVMLYWNDPPAAAVASQTLVNNLDLEVITPAPVFATVLPLILDTLPGNVGNSAQQGIDNINNVEQVVIKNPTGGDYTFRINPTNIAQNPSQDYYIVYDFVPLETKIVSPVGGETYLQGENALVHWDSYGDPANTFTLDYSLDNGANWTVLKNNIEAHRRTYYYAAPDPNEWFIVPAVTTDQALIRISRNGTGYSSTSLPFVIHDTLFCSLSAVQCEGYFSIDWTAVPGATGYEVLMLQGTEMTVIASVTAATFTYTLSGLNKDSVYWMSVRPLIGSSNSPGRRGIAVSRKPDSGTCTGNISDNDIKTEAIVSPARSGRLLTSTALGNSVPVTISIKNLDDNPTPGNITVTYILNGGTPVIEVLTNPAIPAGSSISHPFSTNINMLAAGNYTLEVSVSQAGDPVTANNTITKTFKQLDNPDISGIDYPAAYVDNFDAAPVQSYTSDQVGLTGLDKYDFVNSNDTGRIRTFINTGIAYSGNRALTLDGFMYNPAGYTDSLTGTFNIATYNAATDDIRLDFRYKNHGQTTNAANKVWIRGDDAKNWVEAYDLYVNQNPADGSFKFTTSIEISDLLQDAVPAQNFSESFQVRWGQFGWHMAADNNSGSGYTFDDIRLYKVTDDMQMLAIDTPVVNSCGLTATTPVRVIVRNSSNSAVSTVPVQFRYHNGVVWSGWTIESIPSIPANDTVQYTFTGTANMAAAGNYRVEAEVMYPTDTYDVNDTTSTELTNTPVITVTNATPHLQNFETDNGYWYTLGNSSWEYGTPASYKINRAASGSKAWKTRLAGNYDDNGAAILYSPCYDVSTMTNPTLSFSLALDLEDCGAGFCDGTYVEYSTDGRTWSRLGTNGQGFNWYNKTYSGNNLWSVQNYHRWHVATIPLSVTGIPVAQLTQLRFRFVVSSDPAVNRDGVGIDDIHIYSNPNGIYNGGTMGSPVTQNLPASSGWVDFMETGTLVASVKTQSEMGSTDVQAYIHTGAVRINGTQYYHNRNITIKPANVNLADSATVRFYFRDSETEALISATGCPTCSKPAMAYELGVTKYSDTNDGNENGTLADNATGMYQFITSAKTSIVPFDIGYYAEFKVKDFSEFWLNNGSFNGITPLPLKLLSFTARKKNTEDVLLEWVTTEESNVNRFEVEVAKGNAEYQLNRFSQVGLQPSQGNSSAEQRYSMLDTENNKSGVRYYRLKMIDNDGSFTYSPVRPVAFTGDWQWQVYPNPSAGLFNLVIQVNDGEEINVKVYDAAGRLARQHKMNATGFVQKIPVDLKSSDVASGLYLLEVTAGDKKQSFRLLKQ